MGGGLPQLTTGFCDEIVSSADSKDPGWPTSPTLQILQTKAIENGGRTYWRAVVSDGVHTTQAMVVTQLNSLLENGEVGEGSIILVQQFVINTIQNRPIVIIIALEVLGKGAEVIGNPVPRPFDHPEPSNPAQRYFQTPSDCR